MDKYMSEIDKLKEIKDNEIYKEIKRATDIYFKSPYEEKDSTLVDYRKINTEQSTDLLTKIFNKINFCYQNPLHIVLKETQGTNRLLIRLLLKTMSVKDINSSDYEGNNLFHVCAYTNKVEDLNLLLENKEEKITFNILNNINNKGYTPLLLALERNNLLVARNFIPFMSEEGITKKINTSWYYEKDARDIARHIVTISKDINRMLNQEKNK